MNELFNVLKIMILRNTVAKFINHKMILNITSANMYLHNYVSMILNMFFSLLRNKYLSVTSRLSIDCFYASNFSVDRTFRNSTKSTKLVETRVAIYPRDLRTIK